MLPFPAPGSHDATTAPRAPETSRARSHTPDASPGKSSWRSRSCTVPYSARYLARSLIAVSAACTSPSSRPASPPASSKARGASLRGSPANSRDTQPTRVPPGSDTGAATTQPDARVRKMSSREARRETPSLNTQPSACPNSGTSSGAASALAGTRRATCSRSPRPAGTQRLADSPPSAKRNDSSQALSSSATLSSPRIPFPRRQAQVSRLIRVAAAAAP